MQVKTAHGGGQVCGDGRHPAGRRTQSGNAVVKGVRGQRKRLSETVSGICAKKGFGWKPESLQRCLWGSTERELLGCRGR